MSKIFDIPETQVHPVDRPDIPEEFTPFDRLFNCLGWVAIVGLILTVGAELLRH